ncbi:bifunctional UDP-N-acetylglucosamine diphosphorylase/glucosamine-1-phosphate N-acetyltransferase GlmU [Virgibacillus sp. MSP4-1]|uniref:bifunctional UDP-N-acetylglucosamine diphosphorylase/glucosamine-1-phosphate N-acetyltransferase GlmU n=1 Tax=Virgibacillus sp. MSP4-1 TaxID=2700081 RepID=UPI00039BA88C|nr:bifunctional UDP-N-acetylglucosamine diphosphorylase/glucosamine-1-phosphate N-acetyltransferase GlmU [Virgibacillus sp. MSP4-1]QHS23885.1 bifunctional UDP-N-acetylglucosamine diphosphorylase/glucosamine-1-phosphate N-acetyltransferase GlmU [Virgibacillus sp. MSP4-1]
MSQRFAVVLAAGQGTRMKSSLYKVLHPVCGKPMVQHVTDQLNELKLSQLITVVGFGAEKVKDELGDATEFVIQEEQLGTGHAVMQAEELLSDKEGTTLVVCGDTPLLTAETLEAFVSHHEKEAAKVSVLTAGADDPAGYGRVVRNEANEVEKIVEHKDASPDELAIKEINTGTYCFDNQALFNALKDVSNDNAQGEYYLPDVIEILKSQGEKIAAYQTDNFAETMGVNDRVALSRAEKHMRIRINEGHMRNGVTLIDPEHTYIGPDVKIEQDVIIEPGCTIDGSTVIRTEAFIGANTEIKNCEIGSGTTIKQSVAHDSKIGEYVKIGPYAHIRPSSDIKNNVKIGNFVEVKKSVFEEGSKASHLSYVGDAEVGKEVNIGCGTITVNYDGENKHKTIIEDGAFIGCNSNLVAPVTIEKGAYVAAGSTITKNVPEESLSIARSRQTNKEGYVERLKNIRKK